MRESEWNDFTDTNMKLSGLFECVNCEKTFKEKFKTEYGLCIDCWDKTDETGSSWLRI